MGMAERKHQNTPNTPRKRRVARIRVKTRKMRKKKDREAEIRMRRTSFLNKVLTAVLIITVLTGSGLVLKGHNDISKLSVAVNDLEDTLEKKITNRDYLTMELEPYKEPGHIEDIARTSLGMDYPTKDQYIYYNGDRRASEDNGGSNTYSGH